MSASTVAPPPSRGFSALVQLLIRPQCSPLRVRCLLSEPHRAWLLLSTPCSMGNAQSHGQPHNRLVKPKTNTNSPSLAPDVNPNVDSPASLASRYLNLSASDRQQIKSQLLSPVQTDFGPRESFEEDENLDDNASPANIRLSSRSNSMSCFGSKTSSTTRLSSLPTSKVSLVQSSQPVDLETAISILQEVQKNASPEDIAALRELTPGPPVAVQLLIRAAQSKFCNPAPPALRLAPRASPNIA